MAITEQQRHQLFTKLEELIGIEEATTLMEHLPPVGWADVATKADLDHHQALTRADIERSIGGLRADSERAIGALELRMERGFRDQTRTMVLTNLGSMIALASVLIAALRV